MDTFGRLAFWAVLATILSGHSQAKPIEAEEVASLLPETPKTKNETVAAIVQDPVVQNAVQSIVGDGSLSGLVVKKSVVILPANAPHVVISQTEQVLTAPAANLEDIRKNISEAVQVAEVGPSTDLPVAIDGSGISELVADFPIVTSALEASPQEASEDVGQKEPEDGPQTVPIEELPQITQISSGHKYEVPGINLGNIKLPDGVFPQKIMLPQVVDEKISASVVAVLKPSNATEEGLPGSVISLLPGPVAVKQQDDVRLLGDDNQDIVSKDGPSEPEVEEEVRCS